MAIDKSLVNLRRNSDLFHGQPLFAFIELTIISGGVPYKVSDFQEYPNISVTDFSYTRKIPGNSTEAGNSFSITVYDDTALEFENMVYQALSGADGSSSATGSSTGTHNITIHYGWNDYNGNIITDRTINGNFVTYSLDFDNGGISLTIEGTSVSIVAINNAKSESYDASVYGGKPSKIVEKLLKDSGVEIGEIEDTEPVLDESGNPRSFIRTNETESHMIESLKEVSVSSSTGHCGYIFYIDEEDKAYFVSNSKAEEYGWVVSSEEGTDVLVNNVENGISDAEAKVNDSGMSSSESRPTKITGVYEYYCGKEDNQVLEFTPEFSRMTILGAGVSGESLSIDSLANQIIDIDVNSGSDGKKVLDENNLLIMGRSSSKLSELNTISETMWNRFSARIFGATLVVMGDPNVCVGTSVLVLVYLKSGLLHHTSGLYYVRSAEDEISGGDYRTTLTLQKNGSESALNDTYGVHSSSYESVNSGFSTGTNNNGTGSSVYTDTFASGSDHYSEKVNSNDYQWKVGTFVTGSSVLEIAASQIGIVEYPPNSDNIKYNTWYYGRDVNSKSSSSNYWWCMAFVQWCYDKAGNTLPYKTASCSELLNWYKSNKPECIVTDPRPGDIIIFSTSGTGKINHTGIFESLNGNNVVSIDGNTEGNGGSQSNGGAVMRRSRSVNTVVAYIRP